MTNPTSNLATNLTDAYEICDVEPLQGKDLDKYYIPLSILRTKLKGDKPVLAKLGVLGMGFNQGLV